MMKKILFGALCLIMMSLGGVTFAASDVDTAVVDELLDMLDKEIANIGVGVDEELTSAVALLYSNEITKFDTVDGFMPYQSIRRDEAAKMYVNFAKNVLKDASVVEQNPVCSFTDLHLGHSDLPGLMIESCNRGLFKGYMGAFMPTDSITNAQAIIVLIRMIDGDKEEPVGDHYATNYMATAESLGLLDDLNIGNKSMWDMSAERATIAKLLSRSATK